MSEFLANDSQLQLVGLEDVIEAYFKSRLTGTQVGISIEYNDTAFRNAGERMHLTIAPDLKTAITEMETYLRNYAHVNFGETGTRTYQPCNGTLQVSFGAWEPDVLTITLYPRPPNWNAIFTALGKAVTESP